METAFSVQLQKLRREKGVTQDALASFLRVSPQAVSKWENGSYPDGDLLPKIADYFGVSIDRLYGRGSEERSVPQQILDLLREAAAAGDNNSAYFEKIMKVLWAVQLSAWRNNRYYYDRPEVGAEDCVTASENTCNGGFSFMRLNKDLEYFFFVKQPAEGFAKRLKVTDRAAELFAFLGDKTNLKILQFMLSLKGDEAIRPQTIAKLLHIPAQKAEKALEYLCTFSYMFLRGSIVDENNKTENIYRSNQVLTIAPILLFICAEMMIKPPDAFQNQVSCGDEEWFKRGDLDFIAGKE
ncbi:MAG: helix-turn-helix transcriptional regulator [Oscillospiraceae bacterium]|nr:helix-turn-helix transcriptional regulator [Oscillospiraceae bacterium]